MVQKDLFIFLLFVFFFGCSHSPATPDFTNESGIEILWGMGNDISQARKSPIVNQAPVRMMANWFSKPEDLEWMRSYVERNTMATLYEKGYAQQLIIYLADHTEYAVSQDFQADLEDLIKIFKGNGPEYGPLYVVLFTEYETYSDDSVYFQQLRDAFFASRETIKQTYDKAYVSIGFGGYKWIGVEKREFKDWELEVLKAGDFAAVQAHHRVRHMNLMAPQIRKSVEQLGDYGKPVMLSHFRIWKEEDGLPLSTTESFHNFIFEMFPEDSMAELQEDGLFSWSFFSDSYINRPGAGFEAVKEAVKTYGSDKTDLSDYSNILNLNKREEISKK